MRRAVLFDLDNTVHDRDSALLSFVRSQYRTLGLDRFGIPESDWTRRFITQDDLGRTWKDEVYRALCREFGLETSSQVLLRQYEAKFVNHVSLSADAAPTLNALHESGWRIGIVTNGRTQFQRKVIEALDLEPLVDSVVISEDCGLRKPDPKIFHLALSQLEACAEESWFVGDDLVNDFHGAKNAGMNALWLTPDPSDDLFVISNLSQILKRTM